VTPLCAELKNFIGGLHLSDILRWPSVRAQPATVWGSRQARTAAFEGESGAACDDESATVLGHSGVALDRPVLHFDGTPHGVDCAAEPDNASVARALDDAAIIHRDRGVDEIASQRPQPRQNAIVIRAGDRLKPGLANGAPFGPNPRSTKTARNPRDCLLSATSQSERRTR
jgi:hypothetical protein